MNHMLIFFCSDTLSWLAEGVANAIHVLQSPADSLENLNRQWNQVRDELAGGGVKTRSPKVAVHQNPMSQEGEHQRLPKQRCLVHHAQHDKLARDCM